MVGLQLPGQATIWLSDSATLALLAGPMDPNRHADAGSSSRRSLRSHVLNKQVEEITSGAIPGKAMSTSLSIGVAVSIGLA